MAKAVTIVEHDMGLHAEPAALFVQVANTFESRISVTNLADEEGPIDAKNVLDLLSIAVVKGTTIRIEAEGSDEDEAIDALLELVERGFFHTDQ